MKAWAVSGVVVDQSACLKKRIDRHRTDELKPALFQIAADPVGKAVGNRHLTFRVPCVDDGFSICIVPKIIAKGAEFLPDLLIALCILRPQSDP